MHDLIADGNSVVLVDHDTQVLAESDWLIEMGPEAGAGGGHVIAEGTVADLAGNPASQIGPFLGGQGVLRPGTARRRSCLPRGASIFRRTPSIRSSRWRWTFPKRGG